MEDEVKYGNKTRIGTKDPREPGHYKMAITPVEFIQKNGLSFIEGCIVKYIARHRMKNGKADLEKARHYIDLLIKYEYNE